MDATDKFIAELRGQARSYRKISKGIDRLADSILELKQAVPVLAVASGADRAEIKVSACAASPDYTPPDLSPPEPPKPQPKDKSKKPKPKGFPGPTIKKILRALNRAGTPLEASQIAKRVGLKRGSVVTTVGAHIRRYGDEAVLQRVGRGVYEPRKEGGATAASSEVRGKGSARVTKAKPKPSKPGIPRGCYIESNEGGGWTGHACIERYVDINAKGNRKSPCFGCQRGKAERLSMVERDGYFTDDTPRDSMAGVKGDDDLPYGIGS